MPHDIQQLASTFAKAAEGPATSLAQVEGAIRSGLKREALGDIGNLLLAGLGAGAAFRGASGLYNLYRRRTGTSSMVRPGPVLVEMPLPAEDEEKTAQSFLHGDYATSKTGLPWYMPATVLAMGGGLAGGWKAMDVLLDKRRKAEQDAELEQARAEFRKALLSEYATGDPSKQAAESSELGRELDKLYDQIVSLERMSKEASATDILGKATGAYLTLAAPAALLSGLFAYNMGKGTQSRTLLAKAMKRRLRQRIAERPPEMFAIGRRAGQVVIPPQEPAPTEILNSDVASQEEEQEPVSRRKVLRLDAV